MLGAMLHASLRQTQLYCVRRKEVNSGSYAEVTRGGAYEVHGLLKSKSKMKWIKTSAPFITST